MGRVDISSEFVSILQKKTLVCSDPGQTAGARRTGTARAESDRTAARVPVCGAVQFIACHFFHGKS